MTLSNLSPSLGCPLHGRNEEFSVGRDQGWEPDRNPEPSEPACLCGTGTGTRTRNFGPSEPEPEPEPPGHNPRTGFLHGFRIGSVTADVAATPGLRRPRIQGNCNKFFIGEKSI